MINKKTVFLPALMTTVLILTGCRTYQFSGDPFIVGMRWFDRGDFATAAGYWQPLADAGDCDGQNGMALVLYQQNRKKPDSDMLKQAISYLRKSAAQGHFKSLSALGDLALCEKELKVRCDEFGTKPNMREAFRYYFLASERAISEHDKQYNRQMLDVVKAVLDKKQVSLVEEEVRNWKASPAQCTPRKVM